MQDIAQYCYYEVYYRLASICRAVERWQLLMFVSRLEGNNSHQNNTKIQSLGIEVLNSPPAAGQEKKQRDKLEGSVLQDIIIYQMQAVVKNPTINPSQYCLLRMSLLTSQLIQFWVTGNGFKTCNEKGLSRYYLKCHMQSFCSLLVVIF